MPEKRLRVLFLCTANSARSQVAEAVLRQLSHGTIEVASAGSEPASEIHPMALEALRKLNIPAAGQHPKSMDGFLRQRFDYVITVCDRAAERCPIFPGDPERIHWSVEDPASVAGTPEERQRSFDVVAKQLMNRIRTWLSLPAIAQRASVARS